MNLYFVGLFAIASLLLLLTPEPALLAMLSRGMSQGRRAAIVDRIRWVIGSICVGLGIRAVLPGKSL